MDAARLEDLFAPFGPVRVKRMFGGQGIYRGEIMFALVADDVIYLKSDALNAAAFDAASLAHFTYERNGKPYPMSYRRMPDVCFDDPDALVAWARLGHEAALRGAARSAVRRPSSPRPPLDRSRR